MGVVSSVSFSSDQFREKRRNVSHPAFDFNCNLRNENCDKSLVQNLDL
jgi:hypothetical protein